MDLRNENDGTCAKGKNAIEGDLETHQWGFWVRKREKRRRREKAGGEGILEPTGGRHELGRNEDEDGNRGESRDPRTDRVQRQGRVKVFE